MQERVICIVTIAVVAVCMAGPLAGPAAAGVKICEHCRDPIVGTFVEASGNYYHTHHLFCDHCGDPIEGPFTVHRKKNYHSDCFEHGVALRCSLCEAIIQGEYLIDFWGNSYHRSHQNVVQSCNYCSRFISTTTTGGGARYSDGRHICNICRGQAVTSVREAQKLMEEVAGHMRAYGLNIDTDLVRLHMVGLTQMQQWSGKAAHNLTGYTDYVETWRAFSKDRQVDVYVLYGMPRMDVINTLAHELTHVWQFVHGKLRNDRAFSEGSCNYAAYLVLERYDDREAAYLQNNMLEDRDAVYGDGFRRVKRYAEKKGLREWLTRLRKRDSLPRGY